MKGRVRASRRIRASSLPALDLSGVLASLFCSPEMLARGLTQGFCWVVQDLGVIAKDESLNVILPNRLADPLGMELLEM